MQKTTSGTKVFAALLAAILATGAAAAQDKKPDSKPLDRKTLDESIYQSLRGVIDHGADLYNQGDWNGCYRLWEGSLMSLKPMLDHRPKLQEAIDGGLSKARQDPVQWQRAWALRPVLDKIRADINADYPHKRKREAGEPPFAREESKPKTLWGRLGGESGVSKIVDDFFTLAAPDPKIDFSRGGKYKPTPDQVAKMKRELVEQVSQASGGPLKYTGPDMKSVHKGMGITEAQFDAAAADLKKALEKYKVAPEDVKQILDAVASYRKEIVEPKKTEAKKREEKKPAEKKEEKKNGKKGDGTSRLEGKITYQGKPLGGGTISLVGSDGLAYSGTIDAEDGTYLLQGMKPGEYKVAVNTKANAKIPQVPAKYSDSDKSGLTVNVREGKQTFDIALQ
jgi:truncated hemoglobin YjbI